MSGEYDHLGFPMKIDPSIPAGPKLTFGNLDRYRMRYHPVGENIIKTDTLEVYEYTTADKQPDGRIAFFYCPGCKARHTFNIERPDGKRPCWTWDGNVESPTFEPSLLISSTRPVMDPTTGQPTDRDERYTMCHLFLRAGVIEFLADCEHDLKGQKVPLPSMKGH